MRYVMDDEPLTIPPLDLAELHRIRNRVGSEYIADPYYHQDVRRLLRENERLKAELEEAAARIKVLKFGLAQATNRVPPKPGKEKPMPLRFAVFTTSADSGQLCSYWVEAESEEAAIRATKHRVNFTGEVVAYSPADLRAVAKGLEQPDCAIDFKA